MSKLRRRFPNRPLSVFSVTCNICDRVDRGRVYGDKRGGIVGRGAEAGVEGAGNGGRGGGERGAGIDGAGLERLGGK